MDYYEGETLKSKISKELLSLDVIIHITTQIAEGLSVAHKKGIIHRDIKPANIFVTKEGIVKILDFGLAKKIDRTQFTRRDVKFGTTEYMSPEQIKGEKVDLRTGNSIFGIESRSRRCKKLSNRCTGKLVECIRKVDCKRTRK